MKKDEKLVCPVCKIPTYYDKLLNELICIKDRVAYPIRHGLPILLIDKARYLDYI